jgi:ABC-2 type transport system permease protein
MRSTIRLAALHLRIGAMNELQYRVNFFVQLVQSLLSVGTGLVVLALVFGRTEELGGWSRPQLLVVMGIFTMVGGFIRSVIQPNMQRLTNDVRLGTLDYALTKPADAQVLVSVRDIRIWEFIDVVLGAIIVIVAATRLPGTLGVGDVAAFIAVLFLGLVIVYCFWLLLATASFWLTRLDEVQELFDGLFRAGQYPVGIYPPWLRFGLTFLVPLAFAITVPAEALTGRLDAAAVVLMVALTGALVVASRWVWRRGLRRYAGASA